MTAVRPRANTFRVDLSNFPKRPTFEEVHSFVHTKIGLSFDEVLRLQMNHSQNCVQVKCVNLKVAQDAVERHHEKHVLQVDGSSVLVKLMMDDGGVDVKIHDLSENVSNDEIMTYLKPFGEILSIRDLVWGENFAYKGKPTGARVVKMILNRHIKSFVTIANEVSLVTYKNQPATCRHCTNPSHPGITCVENKKLLAQKTDLNKRLEAAKHSKSVASYSSVVANSTSFVSGQILQSVTTPTAKESSTSQDNVSTPATPTEPLPEEEKKANIDSTQDADKEQTQDAETMVTDDESSNQSGVHNTTISSNDESHLFKLPKPPLPSYYVEISDSDGSCVGDLSPKKNRRGKDRAKKAKIDYNSSAASGRKTH